MLGSESINPRQRQFSTFWLVGVCIVDIVCQLALLVPALGPLRIVFRIAAFAASLIALVLVRGRATGHPARFWLAAVVCILISMLLHPHTNSPLSGVASVMLNVAVLAPVFWVAQLKVDARTFVTLTIVLWAFSTLSASVGVLQTKFPGRFVMPISSIVMSGGKSDGLKITLADGSRMFRPTGLTDTPGGASQAGFFAFLFGLGFLTTAKKWPLLVGSVLAIAIGLYCISISQVRVHFVLAGVCSFAYFVSHISLGRYRAPWIRLALIPLIMFSATVAAFTVGGSSTTERLKTLVAANPQEVYNSNRGVFLRETFQTLVPEFPLGAGLGRWGMVRYYFGDESNLDSPPIWAEIQYAAWVLDGGLPLMICYCLAIIFVVVACLRCALTCGDPQLASWGFLIVGYDISVIALTFSYSPFIGQIGAQFWLFNTAYWVAAQTIQRDATLNT